MEPFDLSYLSLGFILLSVFFAAFISSVTGMAGGVLMFSALYLFIPLRPLIAIHGSVQVINNGARSWFLRNSIKKTACIYFAFGALLGTAITTYFVLGLISEEVSLLILLTLIAYTLFKPKKIPSIRVTDKQYFWVGIATGSLGIVAGAIDPLLAAFFLREDYSKEEIVANKSMMQCIAHATKIPAFIYLGFSFEQYLPLIAALSVAAILGSKLGITILNKIPTVLFFRIMWWVLFFSGLYISLKIFGVTS